MTNTNAELHASVAGQLVYSREKDGTSYWVMNQRWVGAPRCKDGTIDINCVFYVDDMQFADHIDQQELYNELNLFSFRF